MNIRITKELKFEMAHALLGHDGSCKNIHGHSYHLAVTIIGKPINDLTNPKNGMVVDFSDLKKVLNEEIIEPFDHALMLNKNTDEHVYCGLQGYKLILMGFQPTCENLILYISARLKEVLPSAVKLHHLLQ